MTGAETPAYSWRRMSRSPRNLRRSAGFDRPVENALAAGIPVFSYNADSAVPLMA
jgi:hypothetical protein